MKKPLAFLLFTFFVHLAYSQENAQPLDKPVIITEPLPFEPKNSALSISNGQLNSIAPGGLATGRVPTASPEIQSINLFQDIPVNQFTGTPLIELPIYTLSETGGATVPIRLSYNATGMRGHEVSGWTGMNWTLMAGGQITRIVRGLPDEGKFNLNNDYTTVGRKGFFQHGIYADNNQENDGQPDLFFLNIEGNSYKFSFDANKKAHFYPEADIEVLVTWQPRNLLGAGDPNSVVGKLVNWVVLMPDGTKYFFAGPSAFESSFEIEAEAAKNLVNPNWTNYYGAEDVVSAFYLTKIETAFGHQTLFDYRPTAYSYFRVAEQSENTNNCDFNNLVKKINKVYVNSSALYKIQNGSQVVEFNKDGWEQITDGYGRLVYRLNNTYPRRQDIDEFTQFPQNSSAARALYKIAAYTKDDPSKVLNWALDYEYNYGGDSTSLFLFATSYASVGETHKRRLFLKKLTEPNGNEYSFDYYFDGNPANRLPSRFTMGIDHWGGINQYYTNNKFIGQDPQRPCATPYANIRSVSPSWAILGSLKFIEHNTGSKTNFTYQTHQARNYAGDIGGLRIAKIINEDLISNLKTVKTYEYLQENGQSSGFLSLEPTYHFDNRLNFQGAPTQYWNSGLYQQLLGDSGRPTVGYSRVKETILSDNEAANIGYTVTEFNQSLSPINLYQTVVTNCRYEPDPNNPNGPPIYVCDPVGTFARPYLWRPFHEFSTGIPTRTSIYNGAHQLLSEKTINYDEQTLRANVFSQNNYRAFRMNDLNYSFETSYDEVFKTYRPSSESTKTYDTQGNNPVITTTNYFYDPSTIAKHNQVVRTTTTDAQGHTITQNTSYAADFSFSPNASLSGDAPGIKALQDKHILNAVILSSSQKTVGASTFTTAASYQSYYGTTTGDYQAGMPKTSFIAKNMPNIAFNAFSNTGDNVLPHSDFEQKASINKYNSIGLATESTITFGPTSTNAYHASYPSISVGASSNIGQASAQSISVSFNPILFGPASQTAPNGLVTTSEYYPDGKLKLVKDPNGHIIKHIQYVYRGQTDTDPLLNTNSGYNRIITRSPRIASTDAMALNYSQCQITVQYQDASGRTLQSLAYRASPNAKDLVSGLTDYDEYSRPLRGWLPVESDNSDGSYYPDASYKAKAQSFYNDTKPYTEVKTYEASPLSRVFESFAEGSTTIDQNKFAKAEYETATGLKKFSLPYNNNSITIDSYTSYELLKSSGTDEKGESSEEYYDKTGKLLEKRIQGPNGWLVTAYIYDTAGRLRYTLTPKAYTALANNSNIADMPSWTGFSAGVYAYEYDGRNRTVRKHSPGTGWQSIVYNRLDQVVMTQDEHEAQDNLWNYSKYDGQGRPVITGQLNYSLDRSQIQDAFDNLTASLQFEERGAGLEGYTQRSYPAVIEAAVNLGSLKAISYFDNYNWLAGSLPFQTSPYGTSAYLNSVGMPTGGKQKIDGQGNTLYPATIYYDNRGRSIQSQHSHELSAANQGDVAYNYAGEATQSRSLYRRAGAADIAINKEQKLDHTGRLTEQLYGISPGLATLTLASYSYDAIGRLATKNIQPNLGSQSSIAPADWNTPSTWSSNTLPSLNRATTVNHSVSLAAGQQGASGTLILTPNAILNLGAGSVLTVANNNQSRAALQSISYHYNVKNQLLGINLDANGNPATSNERLFSYKLNYDFDGNITGQSWQTAQDGQNRAFSYIYDQAKRISQANYTGIGVENYSVGQSYDENGNISTLSRNSITNTGYGLVDNLTYELNNSGRLLKVDDTAPAGAQAGFTDVTGTDYSYYPDGKLQSDANKGISLIEYNHLDLVKKISFTNGSAENFYDATGIKRLSKSTINGLTIYTKYDGEIFYSYTGTSPAPSSYTLAEIQNPEGRFINGALEYGYPDHLGNLRLSYRANATGQAEITQAQSYDPWGLELKGLSYQLPGSSVDKYSWQAKEDLSAQGLPNLTDYGWRLQDRELGRWQNPDPAEQFDDVSTYALCLNNPIVHRDEDGRIIPQLIAAAVGGGLNLWSNWGKIKGFKQGLAYFGSGALGGVVSLGNPLAGGAITSSANALIDISTGNVPQINNFADGATYIAGQAVVGAASSYIGAQVGKAAAPLFSQIGSKLGSWFGWSYSTYAYNTLQTEIIDGVAYNYTVDAGIVGTKKFVAAGAGQLARGVVMSGGSSTGGRLGNAATRNQIQKIAAELKTRGYTIEGGGMEAAEEFLKPIGSGRKGGSFLDITAKHPNYPTLRINTVDVLKDGITPTARELRNATRIRTQIGPGEHLLLIPKR